MLRESLKLIVQEKLCKPLAKSGRAQEEASQCTEGSAGVAEKGPNNAEEPCSRFLAGIKVSSCGVSLCP